MSSDDSYSQAEVDENIDSFLERGKQLIGENLGTGWNETTNADHLDIFLNGIGDINPRWDPQQEGAEVHPAYVTALASPGITGGPDFDHDLEGFIAEIDIEWKEPIHVGDDIDGNVVLDELYEKTGRGGKRYIFDEGKTSYTRDGEEVARAEGTVIRMHIDESEDLLYDRECYTYSDQEKETMKSLYDEEIEKLEDVPETPGFADYDVGDSLPTRICGPLNIGDMVAWNAAKGAPSWGASIINYQERLEHPQKTIVNPRTGWMQKDSHQHEDWVLANQRGMPLPFANGVHMYAWTVPFVTNWMGADGFLERHTARLEEPYFYGDTLWFDGEITEKDEADGDQRVEIEWEAETQRDDLVIEGSSTVQL